CWEDTHMPSNSFELNCRVDRAGFGPEKGNCAEFTCRAALLQAHCREPSANVSQSLASSASLDELDARFRARYSLSSANILCKLIPRRSIQWLMLCRPPCPPWNLRPNRMTGN